MRYDEERDATIFVSRDNDEYWAEDGASYIEGAGTVVLNCLDSEGTETSDSFTKTEALGLAIELARAAGAHEADLADLEGTLRWRKLVAMIEGFTPIERADMNLLCFKLFGMGLLDDRMTEELVEAVITEYRREAL